MTCEKCGRVLQVGDYPFCKGKQDDHGAGLLRVKPDTILGGFWAENAWREPRYFESQKKYEQALDASGLMLKPRKSKGAEPVSPETLRWAAERVAARTKTVEIEETIREDRFVVQAEC